ncbi:MULTISPECIES: NTP transferase domain-containing protein [unclassified Kribbella]|uniref:nucleotidyltransferase family protein n=1 Tax=unclassified Kribbella TaxID=2644121 RepID=UPI0033F32D5E
MKTAGLVLAAGAGRRMGTPKALIRDATGLSWVARATQLLKSAGCSPVVVVVGAAATQVTAELDDSVHVVEATNWHEGMGASLRAGLTALQHLTTPLTAEGGAGTPRHSDLTAPSGTAERGAAAPQPVADAVVVVPVDVPGLTVEVLRRVAAQADPAALVRAVYDGSPGHPVVLGREHWAGVTATAVGDQGARAYLREHAPVEVECGDLADGVDVDTVGELPEGHRIG